MWFPIPAIWVAQGMSATAAGADRLGGHLVEEATRAQVDGAEDRPPPVGARRHYLLAGAAGDPGGPHPGQQVEVGLVLGQHHRPSGSPAMAWRRSASTCSRSGSPLATRRGRRQQATCRTRRRSVRWLRAGRPSRCHSRPIVQVLGWSSNLRMRWCRRGAAQRWPASSGPVAQPAGAVGVVAVDPAAHRARVAAQQLGDGRRRQAMVGQQDHDQAQGGAVRAVEQAQQVARRRRGQEGWRTRGGCIL
jgi:hypothetical protein